MRCLLLISIVFFVYAASECDNQDHQEPCEEGLTQDCGGCHCCIRRNIDGVREAVCSNYMFFNHDENQNQCSDNIVTEQTNEVDPDSEEAEPAEEGCDHQPHQEHCEVAGLWQDCGGCHCCIRKNIEGVREAVCSNYMFYNHDEDGNQCSNNVVTEGDDQGEDGEDGEGGEGGEGGEHEPEPQPQPESKPWWRFW